MLGQIQPVEPDPLVGLLNAFASDPRDRKIDLGIGVYRDAAYRTPRMRAVFAAEMRLAEAQNTKTYLGMEGNSEFCYLVEQLIFGESVSRTRTATIQTVAGSGALRLIANVLGNPQYDQRSLWVPTPSWPNHYPLTSHPRLAVQHYRYANDALTAVDFDALMADLGTAKPNDAVLLHACCHNPTGLDLSKAEFSALANFMAKNCLIPFFDLAYMGFSSDPTTDTQMIRHFANTLPEVLVAVSCSKTFGLYRERVGALSICTETGAATKNLTSNIVANVRTEYSMPPDHGAAVVAEILKTPELRALWKDELSSMRERIVGLRSRLSSELSAIRDTATHRAVAAHKGLFSTLKMDDGAVEALRQDHAIYVGPSGRINISGIAESRLPEVAEKLAKYTA